MRIIAATLNWKRPANVARIATALQRQDYPCRAVVVTTPPSAALPPLDCEVITIPQLGPYSRYAADYGDADYLLLLDDDILPGPGLVRAFADCAGQYSHDLLGLYGRRVPAGSYNFRGISRTTQTQEVDMLVRAYWMPAECLETVRAAYRAWLAAGHGPRMLDDDILAVWACRPRKCLLLSKGVGCTDLPEPYAIGRRMPHRLRHRSQVWRECKRIFGLQDVENAPGINVRQ